ncbi:MAG: hypothetical protein KKB70_05480 [Proteobacteria bacterium]|nr:hypothetical protein [Pseudomonadota bacterium]MBU1612005.1 hypothetical protein [Pseudomonadota bacterium]
MRLDVPFIPDPDYARFLRTLGDQLGSVHFSLHSPQVADARNVMEPHEAGAIIAALGELPGVDRYLLVNARIQDPERYFDQAHLFRTVEILNRFRTEANLTGIVFADAYYLNALSRTAPEVCRSLQAVPSVNCMIDSAHQAFAYLRLVEQTAFAPPARLVLDRSLNRDPSRLAEVTATIRTRRLGLRLLLLANEGCLSHCPYKPAHDAHLALVRMPGCSDRTFAMNRELGCLATLQDEPWRLFSSPFIRPEDGHRFTSLVDGLKVCGRERGGRVYLERAVTAYAQGAYTGNLLSIMDTLGEFEDRWDIPNHELPPDFHDRVTGCHGDCSTCPICRDLGSHVHTKEFRLPTYQAGK